jgi:hypothetical protein
VDWEFFALRVFSASGCSMEFGAVEDFSTDDTCIKLGFSWHEVRRIKNPTSLILVTCAIATPIDGTENLC